MYAIIDEYGELVESGFPTEIAAAKALKKWTKTNKNAFNWKIAVFWAD